MHIQAYTKRWHCGTDVMVLHFLAVTQLFPKHFHNLITHTSWPHLGFWLATCWLTRYTLSTKMLILLVNAGLFWMWGHCGNSNVLFEGYVMVKIRVSGLVEMARGTGYVCTCMSLYISVRFYSRWLNKGDFTCLPMAFMGGRLCTPHPKRSYWDILQCLFVQQISQRYLSCKGRPHKSGEETS